MTSKTGADKLSEDEEPGSCVHIELASELCGSDSRNPWGFDDGEELEFDGVTIVRPAEGGWVRKSTGELFVAKCGHPISDDEVFCATYNDPWLAPSPVLTFALYWVGFCICGAVARWLYTSLL